MVRRIRQTPKHDGDRPACVIRKSKKPCRMTGLFKVRRHDALELVRHAKVQRIGDNVRLQRSTAFDIDIMC